MGSGGEESAVSAGGCGKPSTGGTVSPHRTVSSSAVLSFRQAGRGKMAADRVVSKNVT